MSKQASRNRTGPPNSPRGGRTSHEGRGPQSDGSSRSQRVEAALREAIVTWRLLPGTPLSEVGLAEEYAVSRTPVREAVRGLEQDGLVRIVPGRGVFVAEIGLQDVLEISQMREALEVHAAILAARRQDDVPELLALRDDFAGADGYIRDGRLEDYYELTTRLDEAIAATCGNRRIRAALGSLWDQARRLRRGATLSAPRLHQSIAEHREILDAILARDPVRAERSVRHHLEGSLRHLLSELMATPLPITAGPEART